MLSTGKKNAEVTVLSFNGANCGCVTPSCSSYSVSDLTKFPEISCLAVSFELQVDDKVSLGLVMPQTVEALAFIAKIPPDLYQILEKSQASTRSFVSLIWRS